MEDKPKVRRPRIRKTAPTVRELAEAKKEPPKTSKRSKATGLLSRLLRPLAPLGRILQKIFGWLLPRYFINAWKELRQVTWPSRRETWRLTLAVFIFSAVFGVVVWAVDKGLDEVFKKVVLK